MNPEEQAQIWPAVAAEIANCTLEGEPSQSEVTTNLMHEKWATRMLKGWIAASDTLPAIVLSSLTSGPLSTSSKPGSLGTSHRRCICGAGSSGKQLNSYKDKNCPQTGAEQIEKGDRKSWDCANRPGLARGSQAWPHRVEVKVCHEKVNQCHSASAGEFT
jgi:hypothetical protein